MCPSLLSVPLEALSLLWADGQGSLVQEDLLRACVFSITGLGI